MLLILEPIVSLSYFLIFYGASKLGHKVALKFRSREANQSDPSHVRLSQPNQSRRDAHAR